jgi:hypothetical protein
VEAIFFAGAIYSLQINLNYNHIVISINDVPWLEKQYHFHYDKQNMIFYLSEKKKS